MYKIQVEKGMDVYCPSLGIGKITDLMKSQLCPIVATFGETRFAFTKDGKRHITDVNPTLKILNISFFEGLEVVCDIFGKGVVRSIYEDIKSVYVFFENGHEQVYTSDGRIFPIANITLYPQFTFQ